MVLVGVGLLILCGVLLLLRQSQKSRLFQIRSTETSTAQGLSDAAKYVAERLGEGGSFSQITEVRGVVKCDSPLISEIAREPCAYYEMSVTREYEKLHRKASRRNRRRIGKTRRASETVTSNSNRVPFWIQDATGRILVDPDHAEIDSVKTVDRFEPVEKLGEGSLLRSGSLNIDVGNLPFDAVSGSRTLGYRLTERLLPLERQVYVLGEARDASGQLAIERPREKGKKLIISLKSKEELIDSTDSAIRWLSVSAVASGASGIGLILADLIH